MALYTAALTVPPNTSEGAPVQYVLHHGGRRLHYASILFPNGCFNVVGIKLMDDYSQFAPLPSGWIFGNDRVVAWSENIHLSDTHRITIQGYSLAEDWPHTPIVYLEID